MATQIDPCISVACWKALGSPQNQQLELFRKVCELVAATNELVTELNGIAQSLAPLTCTHDIVEEALGAEDEATIPAGAVNISISAVDEDAALTGEGVNISIPADTTVNLQGPFAELTLTTIAAASATLRYEICASE